MRVAQLIEHLLDNCDLDSEIPVVHQWYDGCTHRYEKMEVVLVICEGSAVIVPDDLYAIRWAADTGMEVKVIRA